jgi:hypothetical protein
MTAPTDRVDDWPEALADFVEERRATPFAWGSNDCVTHAADAVLAMTGVDVLGELRGSWSTESAALALLDGLGGMQAAVTAALGQPLANVAYFSRGDVALIVEPTDPPRTYLAVVLGPDLVAPGSRQARRLPWSWVGVVWPVGRVSDEPV